MRFLTLILMLCASTFLMSNDQSELEIEKFWVRAVPSVSKVSAAFGIIKNNSRRNRMLIEVRSDVSEFVELHTHKKQKRNSRQVLKMRKVDFIKIPAKASVELKRLSYHVMFINLKKKLEVGQKVNLSFIFDNGTQIQQLIEIKKY